MLSFENDYNRGAHDKILQRLIETNLEQETGYGNDRFCASAKEKICKTCNAPDADVFFLTGGTQTNATVIDSLLRPYQGVVSAQTGHVNVHESGAIEFGGHKVITLPEHDGKIAAEELEQLLNTFWGDSTFEHMVFPGMVYISYPTEVGSLYSKSEFAALSEVCRRYEIPLYVDGARMGYGLMSEAADVTLADIAQYCDAFYIGGTKVGALCGEAVVFPRHGAPKHFVTTMKQHGALLAKGRLLGVQFDTLFTDDLYFEISRNAIQMANQLKEGFRQRGYAFAWESPTNQQFILLENGVLEQLTGQVMFSVWEKPDAEHTVVRFATSWATQQEDLEQLWCILDNLK